MSTALAPGEESRSPALKGNSLSQLVLLKVQQVVVNLILDRNISL